MKPKLRIVLRSILKLQGRAWFIALSLACWQMSAVRAATLTDFGYQNLKVNGNLTLGTRPLLAIFVNFAGQVPLPQSLSYYSNIVFNTSLPQSMAGFYQASSDGAFTIVPGGAILLSLSGSETHS